MKKINRKIRVSFLIGIFLLLGIRFLFLQFSNPVYFGNSNQEEIKQNVQPDTKTEVKQEVIQAKQKELFTPPPLLKTKTEEISSPSYLFENSGFLDAKGIILLTNIQRERYGFTSLSENSKLDNSAEIKLNDIFQKQYFEHVSPNGTTIEDLSKESEYDFILIGENLAMGDFENDRDLVDAWMASPGHRANILKSQYKEIGVSVKKGFYQGKNIWVAVQHFGLSSNICPGVDLKLKEEASSKKIQLDAESVNLNALKSSIENILDKTNPEYEKDINNYNDRIGVYNQEIIKLKEETAEYNRQVKLYNDCITKHEPAI